VLTIIGYNFLIVPKYLHGNPVILVTFSSPKRANPG